MSDTTWIVFRASNGKPGVEMHAFLPRGATVLADGFLSRESAVARLRDVQAADEAAAARAAGQLDLFGGEESEP